MIKKLLLRFFLLHFVLLVSGSFELSANLYQGNFNSKQTEVLQNIASEGVKAILKGKNSVSSSDVDNYLFLDLIYDSLEDTDEESSSKKNPKTYTYFLSHFFKKALSISSFQEQANTHFYTYFTSKSTCWYVLYQVFRL